MTDNFDAVNDHLPPELANGALRGLVVLDITRVVAGPFCSMLLADLGATVIKVENPREPDYARDFPPFLHAIDTADRPGVEELDDTVSAFFAQYNRNKLGITVDLADERGKDVLRALVRRADVLVENFRAGTMTKLGLDYDQLRQINPRLVYTAISGYGQTGPYRRKPAYDNSAQATGGLWSMNGAPDQPPMRVGTIIGDLSATLYAVIGTLAALRHVDRTGQGQLVDVSQQDSVLSLTENAVVSYTVDGKVPKPLGNQHPFVKPYELYPCKDGFVFFGGYTDKFWRISCELFGEPDLADDHELDTMAKRFTPETYEARIRPVLNRWFADRTKIELEEVAGDQVPLSAIKNIAEVVEDPQIEARDMIVGLDYPGYGELRMFGSPIKLGLTPVTIQGPPPRPGEHNDTVLRALADLSAAEITALRADKVI